MGKTQNLYNNYRFISQGGEELFGRESLKGRMKELLYVDCVRRWKRSGGVNTKILAGKFFGLKSSVHVCQ